MNREIINNRFKLAYHRLIAEALQDNPYLLEQARAVVMGWQQSEPTPKFVTEWGYLLAKPIDDVRREIAKTDSFYDWLRNSSPFAELKPGLLSPEARKSLWQSLQAGQ